MIVDKKLLLLSVPLMVVVFASGCIHEQAQKNGDNVKTPVSQEGSVFIKDFSFIPKTLNVKVGTTVIWTNKDSVSHTITSGEDFDSGNLKKGETFSYTFNKPGTFNYICTIHPYMKGKIIVSE